MTGVRNGVATIIKRENPKCLLTHCYCHVSNLAVGDIVKSVPLLKDSRTGVGKLRPAKCCDLQINSMK